jgi:hypothetical protein
MADAPRWARERLIDNRLDEKYLNIEGGTEQAIWREVDFNQLSYASFDLNKGERGDIYTEHRYSG